ncbi:MAG: Hsp20/alpha crystallin family protein [Candidatus Aenigmatarchaeota archaeon]
MPFEDPFEELEKMQKRMNRLMRDFWERGPEMAGFSRKVPVDLKETNGEILIEADLPGFDKDEISVKAKENRVEISAQKKEERKEKDEDFYRHERRSNKVRRSISLPEEVEAEKSQAEMESGVLKIKLPKKEKKKEEEKKIEVK